MRPANLDPNDPQVRTAVFGAEVQEFLHGEIGTFLIHQAERELAQAIEALKKIPPELSQSIAQLQNKIELLEGFEAWLGGAVQDGLNAIRAIDNEEEVDAG
jgi:hypothetical protein